MIKGALLLFIGLLLLSSANGHEGESHDHDHDHDHSHSHDHSHHHHDHDHDHHDHSSNSKYVSDSHVLLLSDDNLQEAIDQFPLILVKFYAPWCGHCKTLAAPYKQLAAELAASNQVIIAEVDCTVQKNACNKHGIRGYPTLKYFVDGESHQYSGTRSKQAISEWLSSKAKEARSTNQQEEL